MRIDELSRDTSAGRARISCVVSWEDCGRPSQEVYFQVESRFGDDLVPNPNAFLLAAVVPALHFGERRVQVEGKVCPQLRNGLTTAMQQLRYWDGDARPVVAIEPTRGFAPSLPPPTRGTASFLSGGIDSLATLRSNRLDFPLDHPGSIRDCLCVVGFDFGGYEGEEENADYARLLQSRLAALAESAAATLIPVSTNLRHLEGREAGPSKNLVFSKKSHGAALAAVAHALSRRVATGLIASTYTVDGLEPWGSHPLLDTNYGSSEVSILHDGLRLGRMDKVGLVADWAPALSTVCVCLSSSIPEGELNCGKCEKCLRTMTGLLVHGKLAACPTLPGDDISPEALQTLEPDWRADSSPFLLLTPASAYFWQRLIGPLRSIGRDDLADVVTAKLSRFRKTSARLEKKHWTELLKRVDRRILGGRLRRLSPIFRKGRGSSHQTTGRRGRPPLSGLF